MRAHVQQIDTGLIIDLYFELCARIARAATLLQTPGPPLVDTTLAWPPRYADTRGQAIALRTRGVRMRAVRIRALHLKSTRTRAPQASSVTWRSNCRGRHAV